MSLKIDKRCVAYQGSFDTVLKTPIGGAYYISREKRKEIRLSLKVIMSFGVEKYMFVYVYNKRLAWITYRVEEICDMHEFDIQDLGDEELLTVLMEI